MRGEREREEEERLDPSFSRVLSTDASELSPETAEAIFFGQKNLLQPRHFVGASRTLLRKGTEQQLLQQRTCDKSASIESPITIRNLKLTSADS